MDGKICKDKDKDLEFDILMTSTRASTRQIRVIIYHGPAHAINMYEKSVCSIIMQEHISHSI